jgi:ADP-ribose pyrophosphatase YjhB (NUDIX family)
MAGGMISKQIHKALARSVLLPWHRVTRGLTIGVRVAVLKANEVLLVRHTYAPGWLFPGGGVDRGETVFDAAVRELREECSVVAEEPPQLHGFFSNERNFPGDHVACLVVRQFRQEAWAPSLEIAEARFFAFDALPGEVTGGTLRRIAEIRNKLTPSADW